MASGQVYRKRAGNALAGLLLLSAGLAVAPATAAAAASQQVGPFYLQCMATPQTQVAPAGADRMTFVLDGGQGDGASGPRESRFGEGGPGAKLSGTFPITGGQVVKVMVGCSGANSATGYAPGGNAGTVDVGANGANGGAASALYVGDQLLAVAGGGGGGGGGAGGGCFGGDGGQAAPPPKSSAGSGDPAEPCSGWGGGGPFGAARGSAGGTGTSGTGTGGGGGGGGGVRGGAGGDKGDTFTDGGGGGGGGAGTSMLASQVTDQKMTTRFFHPRAEDGNGRAEITFYDD